MVQIIIGILVAAALIGSALWRVISRGRGGDIRAAATAGGDMHRVRDGAAGDGSILLARTWSGIGIGGQGEQWNIAVDDLVVGSIADKETVDVAVAPGHHTLRLGQGRHRSAERSFDVTQNEAARFSCHGPRYWPVLVAALVKPDLWISLSRE